MVLERHRVKASAKKKNILLRQERRKYDVNYFTWPKPVWMIVIAVGIWLLVTLTLSPGNIPAFMGPVATFGKNMKATYPNLGIYICAFTVIIHTLEAAYAGKVCHDRGMTTSATIKWVLSTFLFGFSSLMLELLPHKPEFKTS